MDLLTKRLIALIIDINFLGVLLFIIIYSGINSFIDIRLAYGIAYNLWLLKDIYKGRSIGKTLLKINVVDIKVNEYPNLFQVYIRNSFLFLNIIEVVILSTKKNRIGDILAQTKVVDTKSIYITKYNKISLPNIGRFILCFLMQNLILLVFLMDMSKTPVKLFGL